MAEQKNNKMMPILFTLAMGVLGALLNSFAFPFLPEVTLILGNTAFVIVAMRLKPIYALVCALIATSPLYFLLGHPYGFITFGLEALFISYMRTRNWYTFFADIVYWCLIGMPLTALIMWLSGQGMNQFNWFIAFKQGFNGLLYTSIACSIMYALNDRARFSWQHHALINRTLRMKLVYAMVYVTTISLLVSVLLISRHFINTSQSLIDKSLQDTSESISDVVNVYLRNNVNGIELAAKWLSSQPKSEHQVLVDDIHKQFPGFGTMLVTDEQGVIQVASPVEKITLINDDSLRSVADRDYFTQVMNEKRSFISPVFQGRGFGDDAIVAISAPLFENGSIEPTGIIQGSVDLKAADKLHVADIDGEEVTVVIVDQYQQVVYSSNNDVIQLLDIFEFAEGKISNHSVLVLNGQTGESYSYAKTTISNGWQIYTLLNYKATLNVINSEYLLVFVILFLTLVGTTIVANQLGKRLTRPIGFIIDQLTKFKHGRLSEELPAHLSSSSELLRLYQELSSNRNELHEYQHSLEEKVADRTRALNLANEKLQDLASNDGLTKVHNRRYLDDNFAGIQKAAQRNDAQMALIMIDLDFFKRLNDNFGHLIGDKCLIEVAKCIENCFHRETDLVARFGGEEFVAIAPYIDVNALNSKLAELRTSINGIQVLTDDNQRVTLTSSYGAIIAKAEYSSDMLKWINVADDNLYQAKENGRDRWELTNLIEA